MSQNSNIIVQQAIPVIQGWPRVDLNLEGFEAIVQTKGLDVTWEATILCPCRTTDNSNLSTCQNCMGTGWVMVNKTQTKMILHSMNANTKYKEWSEEKLGTASVTAMNRDKLSFMDRIIVNGAEGIQSQVIYTKLYSNQVYAYTIYDIESILDLFVFVDATHKLTKLEEGIDYTYTRNKILFTSLTVGKSISIRYKHKIQYHIIDLPHDVRNSYEIDTNGRDSQTILPINAIAKRSHYILDSLNYLGDNILDNSYTI